MTLKHKILSRRKLTTSIAAGAAAIALAIGGYAIADSGSSSRRERRQQREREQQRERGDVRQSHPLQPRSTEPGHEGRSGPGELQCRGGHENHRNSGE